MIVDGVRTATAGPGGALVFDTTKVADGWHDVWVVAIDDTPIAVQGGWIGEVQVKNGAHALQLAADPLQTDLEGAFTVTVNGTGSGDVEVWHNGRTLGSVAGGRGELTIAARLLGRGKGKLTATQSGTPPVRSRSVIVEVR